MGFGGSFGRGWSAKRYNHSKKSSHPKLSIHQTSATDTQNEGNGSGIAIIGRFSDWPQKQRPDESYLADALESLGLRVFRVHQESIIAPIMRAKWAIFTGYPTSISRLESWGKTHLTAVWTLDWIPDLDGKKYIIGAAKKSTLFFSSDQFDWKSLEVVNHRYLPGACESVSASFAPNPRISCAFMGTVYNERRRQIARIVESLGGTVLGDPDSWRYGERFSKFVQTVKVVVGDNFRNDVQGYWSTRNYIVPGAGGFLLTPRVPGLELEFALDREIAVYDSIEELKGKISGWIENDEAREKVRGEGYRKTRAEHHWQARAKALTEHLAGVVSSGL